MKQKETTHKYTPIIMYKVMTAAPSACNTNVLGVVNTGEERVLGVSVDVLERAIERAKCTFPNTALTFIPGNPYGGQSTLSAILPNSVEGDESRGKKLSPIGIIIAPIEACIDSLPMLDKIDVLEKEVEHLKALLERAEGDN